jgi:glycosyltransferase involved in cell wall biosynthesis
MPSSSATPHVSVIVRSYNRLAALCELLDRLLAQRHDSFEIVVVDQSTRVTPADEAALAQRVQDPRVRLLRFPPLGGPGARNQGVRAARGEILLFIDDDDLPATDDWITAHLANFADPMCLGVTGRSLVEGGKEPPYRWMKRAEAKVMSMNWLGWQSPYARVNVRKQVDTVHGGNVSLRRSAIERAGLWDECTPIEDELSFNYRLRARLRPGEYLVFDPQATMLRRFDVPGGMDKRYQPVTRFGRRVFTFMHNIQAHYLPVRFRLLYPAYAALLFGVCVDHVWDDSHGHQGVLRKVWTVLWFAAALPFLWSYWLAQHAARRLREGPLVHEPRL